jgi:hypothetical protein
MSTVRITHGMTFQKLFEFTITIVHNVFRVQIQFSDRKIKKLRQIMEKIM